jgi:thiamine pyrophosphate-dependent acetolactate synthase large subunit-like protein
VESFGAHGIVVTKNEDIARALEEAKHVADQGRPVLVNVHIGTFGFIAGSRFDRVVNLSYYYHAI